MRFFIIVTAVIALNLGVGFGIPVLIPYAMVAVVILGMLAMVLFYLANDCLICPYCGQRVVKEIRKTWDKEDCERRRRILRGEKITCCYCGAEVDTGR